MANKKKQRAVVLLSGGLDSATTLYLARETYVRCFCLIFDYGQRHKREINSAKKIAQAAQSPYQVLKIDFPWKGSALLDKKIEISLKRNKKTTNQRNNVPSTYVPARNIVFLSFALSYAEAIKAEAVFIGANAIDFSGYPDCRPEFYKAFQKAADRGTRQGTQDKKIEIKIPLIDKTKAQIIKIARKFGVPFELTWSCYLGGNQPCGACDSCYFRAKGFREAKIRDPLLPDSNF